MLGLAAANATPWDDFKELIKREYYSRDDIHKLEVESFNMKMTGSEIEAYTKRSNKLAILCPTMVDPPIKSFELYLKGLVPGIQNYVMTANLATIQDVTHLAHRLTDQAVGQNKLPQRISDTTTTTTSTTSATLSANDVTRTTAGSATEIIVNDATSLVMEPKMVETHVLQARTNNNRHKIFRISSNSRVTRDVIRVVLKVSSRDTAHG